MNGKDLLLGLGYVSVGFINEAENKMLSKKRNIIKMVMPMAAAVALVTVSLFAYKSSNNLPLVNSTSDILPSAVSKSENSGTSSKNYSLKLNSVTMELASRIAIHGHFWYDLDAAQAAKVLPVISQKYELTGAAHYSSADGKAALYELAMNVAIDGNMSGKITVSPNEIKKDYSITGEPIVSQIEGVAIEAGVFVTDTNSNGEQSYIYYANFKMDDISYDVEFISKNETAEDAFTNVLADAVLGGRADLSPFENPVIPKIIENNLTESEAYSEAEFGKYLIEMPDGYLFNSAYRLLNQNNDLLLASWSNGYNDVDVRISRLDENSKERIVSPNDTALFDLSLYPVPWADSMPREQYQIIENPVFRREDLTLEMIKRRGYTHNETTDPSGNSLSLQFSVLYDDIVVEIRSEGLSVEYLFEKLTTLTTQ